MTVLEPAAQAFADATAKPPFLFQITPDEGRKAVDEVQTTDYPKLPVDEEWVTAADGTKARIVKPQGATGVLPVILYIHGAGWVFGNAHTHDRLVRELAVGAGAAVVFPEYSRRRFGTRTPSSRTTRSPAGSLPRARSTAWTRSGWRSRATRSAGT
jgi:acetyl esterase/lipase